jgi:CheY-like chemotaxis protein
MTDTQMIEILIVDDDEGDTFLTQEALRDAKVANSLHVVHDGVEALEFMEKAGRYSDAPTPDLVLLDINMPRMNGYEVLSWMRKTSDYKLTPVVILTTSSAEHDVMKSYEESANCYITKPVDLEQFHKVVSAIDSFWTGVVKLPPKPKE